MIKVEIHAAGIGNLEKIMELDHQLDVIPGLHYKVDANLEIVMMEFDKPVLMIAKIQGIFAKIGLPSKIVGEIPPELARGDSQMGQRA